MRKTNIATVLLWTTHRRATPCQRQSVPPSQCKTHLEHCRCQNIGHWYVLGTRRLHKFGNGVHQLLVPWIGVRNPILERVVVDGRDVPREHAESIRPRFFCGTGFFAIIVGYATTIAVFGFAIVAMFAVVGRTGTCTNTPTFGGGCAAHGLLTVTGAPRLGLRASGTDRDSKPSGPSPNESPMCEV